LEDAYKCAYKHIAALMELNKYALSENAFQPEGCKLVTWLLQIEMI